MGVTSLAANRARSWSNGQFAAPSEESVRSTFQHGFRSGKEKSLGAKHSSLRFGPTRIGPKVRSTLVPGRAAVQVAPRDGTAADSGTSGRRGGPVPRVGYTLPDVLRVLERRRFPIRRFNGSRALPRVATQGPRLRKPRQSNRLGIRGISKDHLGLPRSRLGTL